MILEKYRERLRTIPPPGGGRHFALLGIANLGVMAGVDPAEIHADIRMATADKPIPDSEIRAAIARAAADHHGGEKYKPPPRPAPIVHDGPAALRRIINQGTISEDVDLWERSPRRLFDGPELDAVVILAALFAPGDLVFIGDRHAPGAIGETIRTAAEWIGHFISGGKAGPFILINPLSGALAPTKNGKLSLRADACVSEYRHALVEFDSIPRSDQIRFWSAAKLPIRALIDTGGKSIHAWIDVPKLADVRTPDEWDREIKGLYEQVFIPLGVDRSCSNPARLSRLPGVVRPESGKFQRLLWLSPCGQKVSP